jgi:hypothetical protein
MEAKAVCFPCCASPCRSVGSLSERQRDCSLRYRLRLRAAGSVESGRHAIFPQARTYAIDCETEERKRIRRKLAGEPGLEPRLTESESVVLPLNYSPAVAAEAWLGCCAALITKTWRIANRCSKKNRRGCGRLENGRVRRRGKKNLLFRFSADILIPTQNRTSASSISPGSSLRSYFQGKLRGAVEKTTWKTPKAAPSRTLTGRRR